MNTPDAHAFVKAESLWLQTHEPGHIEITKWHVEFGHSHPKAWLRIEYSFVFNGPNRLPNRLYDEIRRPLEAWQNFVYQPNLCKIGVI